jgi:hypothetical protein
MNNRIQELIQKATFIGESGYPESKFKYFDKEKFAELIVMECAEIALWQQGKGYDVSDLIKDRFGVK